jgi:hypothetical protein
MQIAAGPANVSPDPAGIAARPAPTRTSRCGTRGTVARSTARACNRVPAIRFTTAGRCRAGRGSSSAAARSCSLTARSRPAPATANGSGVTQRPGYYPPGPGPAICHKSAKAGHSCAQLRLRLPAPRSRARSSPWSRPQPPARPSAAFRVPAISGRVRSGSRWPLECPRRYRESNTAVRSENMNFNYPERAVVLATPYVEAAASARYRKLAVWVDDDRVQCGPIAARAQLADR